MVRWKMSHANFRFIKVRALAFSARNTNAMCNCIITIDTGMNRTFYCIVFHITKE